MSKATKYWLVEMTECSEFSYSVEDDHYYGSPEDHSCGDCEVASRKLVFSKKDANELAETIVSGDRCYSTYAEIQAFTADGKAIGCITRCIPKTEEKIVPVWN